MDLAFYLFATYVFLLVCVCIWLFGRVMKKSRKEKSEDKTSYEKEQRLFALYQNVEDMLNSFEEYVEEAKGETDDRLKKMQDMLEETKKLASAFRVMQSSVTAADIKEAEPEPEPDRTEKLENTERTESLHIVAPRSSVHSINEHKRPSVSPRMSKTSLKVIELYDEGMDQNEIARQLGISVREVWLAMKLANVGEAK